MQKQEALSQISDPTSVEAITRQAEGLPAAEVLGDEIDDTVGRPARGVYISTYGCQMNVSDSDRMYALLEMMNYHQVNKPESADLIIINSCSVREKPVHKVYSEVGKYRKLKQRHPHLKIGVAGCVGQQEKGKLITNQPLIDFVIGPDNIDLLPGMVTNLEEGQNRLVQARFEHAKPYEIETLIQKPGVATFVNITKGCDNFCTFCIVPFTRGRLRSRPVEEILTDIKRLTDRGVKEVTLLGQNVNSYASACGANFSKLLRELCDKTAIERIRYTTSHPKDFDEELMQTMGEYRSKLCDYIHLPVQSGSSRILEAMNRGYTREHYLKKIEMIRKWVPDVSLSTDVIVGFPGETEEDYQMTEDLIREVGYETIYAFKYSPRPFTKAARFTEQVEESAKSDRLTRLLQTHRDQAFELAQKYVGRELNVLVEESFHREENLSVGRTTQNKIVHFATDQNLVGKTVPVKITQAAPSNLKGEWVQPVGDAKKNDTLGSGGDSKWH